MCSFLYELTIEVYFCEVNLRNCSFAILVSIECSYMKLAFKIVVLKYFFKNSVVYEIYSIYPCQNLAQIKQKLQKAVLLQFGGQNF